MPAVAAILPLMEVENIFVLDWKLWETLLLDGMMWALVLARSIRQTDFLCNCTSYVHLHGVIKSTEFGRDETCRIIENVLEFYPQLFGETKQFIGEWIFNCGEELASMD
jgi:hypothetical protein